MMDTHEERTGIYVRTVTSAQTPADMAALMGQFAEKHNSRPLSTWLDETQARAEAIRELDDVPDEIKRDAIEVRGHCLSIRHCAEAGDNAEALYEAYQLGMVVERLGVREWEKYAAKGVKAQRAQQHAREAKQRLFDAKHRQIMEVVEQIRRNRPDGKYDNLLREAVQRLNRLGIKVHESTVARHMRRQKKLMSH